MKNEKRSTENLRREEFIKNGTIEVLATTDFIISFTIFVIGIPFISSIHKDISLIDCLLVYLPIIIILNLGLKKVCYTYFGDTFDFIDNLSTEKYTEVIPILTDHEHEHLFASITDTAKFYAIIKNESEISIYVQFNIGDEPKLLEDLPITLFLKNYKLK